MRTRNPLKGGLGLWLLVAGCWSSAAAQQPDASAVDDIRQYLSRLETLGFAGVVVIARGGEPVLAQGYGLADRERGIPWSPGTVSTVGSITKQFTGAAIVLLAQQGKLSVEDPITKYFDDVPADKQAITLHQLLTHSSGIVDLVDADDWDPIGREEFIRRAMEQPLAFPPGEQYRYSNAGYSLLGAIIEQLSGASYESFLRAQLLVPSGMYETGYILPHWGEGRIAQGYRGQQRWGTVLERPLADDGPYWVLRANGGIHATAYDMLRWAGTLMTGTLLSPASLQTYWAPHMSEGGDSYYGYGWVTYEADGHKIITHNGGNGILFADMEIVPTADLVIFLQTNVVNDLRMVSRLRELIHARILAGESLPRLPAITEVAAGRLASWRGEYALDGGGMLRVESREQSLLVSAADAKAFGVLHSTRPIDAERTERFSARIDQIVTAFLDGDYAPLWQAYARRVSQEFLQQRWDARMRQMEEQHGSLESHEVLGTALRDERDITLVRFLFADGHVDRAYVWDRDAEERLLGVSRRGLGAEVTLYPEGDGTFASWEPRTGESRPFHFTHQTNDGATLRFGEGDLASRATRR